MCLQYFYGFFKKLSICSFQAEIIAKSRFLHFKFCQLSPEPVIGSQVIGSQDWECNLKYLYSPSIQSWRKNFLGVSFLCLGRENPHGTMKHFSREFKNIDICSKEPKSHQNHLNPKPPVVMMVVVLAMCNWQKIKMVLEYFFKKKKQLSFAPGMT